MEGVVLALRTGMLIRDLDVSVKNDVGQKRGRSPPPLPRTISPLGRDPLTATCISYILQGGNEEPHLDVYL